MKNRLLEYSILRGKSEESDEKLEGKIGQVMEVHMDANRTLSQLSYRPIYDVKRPQALDYYTTYFRFVKSKIPCCVN